MVGAGVGFGPEENTAIWNQTMGCVICSHYCTMDWDDNQIATKKGCIC